MFGNIVTCIFAGMVVTVSNLQNVCIVARGFRAKRRKLVTVDIDIVKNP